MVLFRITENEPPKMHNVRPYSRPCGIHIQNKECRRAQHPPPPPPLSSKYVVIFISSFYSQLLVYFIDLLPWFAWLVSLYGPIRSPEFGNFRPSPLCYFNWEGGKNSCPVLARPVIHRTKGI